MNRKSDFDLAATLALTVDEIDLEALDDAQLAELRAAEESDKTPRKTLLRAIDAETTRRAADAAAAVDAPRTMDAPAASDQNAWQQDDYSGPLTIPQAEWRHAHLTPGFQTKTVEK